MRVISNCQRLSTFEITLTPALSRRTGRRRRSLALTTRRS